MESEGNASWIDADWPAPAGIHAGITTRLGGASRAPWDSFNLANHAGDEPAAVAANRRRLAHLLDLPSEPIWLDQEHGNRVIDSTESGRDADACHARQPGIVCAVMVADCIPLLLVDVAGSEIAAVHVGWRGLCCLVAAAAVARFRCGPGNLLAWLGPHISAVNYEVGDDVRDACRAAIPGAAAAFTAFGPRWRADLGGLLRMQLGALGVRRIHADDRCPFGEPRLFFSHRRDRRTGRMAALIWREAGHG